MGVAQVTSPNNIRRAPIFSGRSELQKTISQSLLFQAARELKRFKLTDDERYQGVEVHPELAAVLENLKNRSSGWAFSYVKDGKPQAGHLAESLIPVSWNNLDSKSTLRKIASHSNITLSRKLLSIAQRKLQKDLPNDPKEFFVEYGKWLQNLVEQADSACDTVLNPQEKFDEKTLTKKEYIAWALLNAAGIQLHKICEYAEAEGGVREGATMLHELYRYRDTVHTEAIEVAGLFFEEKLRQLPEDPSQRRNFQERLYDEGSVLHGVAADYSATRNTGETEKPRYNFERLLTPKNRSVLRYIRNKLRLDNPPAIVVVAHTAEHAKYMFDLLRDSKGVSQACGLLLLSGASELDRKNALLQLEGNSVAFIVTTELDCIPKGAINRDAVICSLTHHRKPFLEYPWIGELANQGTPPLVASFCTRGSSDSGRRAGAARKRLGKARATDGFQGDEDLRQLLLFDVQQDFERTLKSDSAVRRQVYSLYSSWTRLLESVRSSGVIDTKAFEEYGREQNKRLTLISYTANRKQSPKGLRGDLKSLFFLQFRQASVFLDPSVVEDIGSEAASKQWATAFKAIFSPLADLSRSPKFERLCRFALNEAFVEQLEDFIEEENELLELSPSERLRRLLPDERSQRALGAQIERSLAWIAQALSQTESISLSERSRQGQRAALVSLKARLTVFGI